VAAFVRLMLPLVVFVALKLVTAFARQRGPVLELVVSRPR